MAGAAIFQLGNGYDESSPFEPSSSKLREEVVIGDNEAQTPSSNMTRKTLGTESSSSESTLAAVRVKVVWTGEADAQTCSSISTENRLGVIAAISAEPEPIPNA